MYICKKNYPPCQKKRKRWLLGSTMFWNLTEGCNGNTNQIIEWWAESAKINIYSQTQHILICIISYMKDSGKHFNWPPTHNSFTFKEFNANEFQMQILTPEQMFLSHCPRNRGKFSFSGKRKQGICHLMFHLNNESGESLKYLRVSWNWKEWFSN